METSLNDMSETNGLNEENLSSLKGMLHQLFHLEDKDLRTYSPPVSYTHLTLPTILLV